MIAISRSVIWLFTLTGLLSGLILINIAGLSLDLSGSMDAVVLIATAGVLTVLRSRFGHRALLRAIDIFEGIAIFLLITVAGILMSYAAAFWSNGYHDAWLAAADLRLGFDWIAMYDFMDRHRELMILSKKTYLSIFATPILIVIAHVLTDRTERLRHFFIVFGLALAVTNFIFLFVPARSAVPYWVGVDPSYPAAVIDQHVRVIDALREGRLTVFDPFEAVGLISFPSFHAAAALLFIWASLPFRRLRLFIIPLNLAMLAATPVEGSHFLIEIIAGLAIAAAVIASFRTSRALRRDAGPSALAQAASTGPYVGAVKG